MKPTVMSVVSIVVLIVEELVKALTVKTFAFNVRSKAKRDLHTYSLLCQ